MSESISSGFRHQTPYDMLKSVVPILLFLFIPSLSFCQQGFLKVFDSSKEEEGIFMDMLNENDTLVFYSIGFDSLDRQGIRFIRIDSFGNVLHSKIIVDSSKTLTTSAFLRSKIIKTEDGYAIIGNAEGNTYFMEVSKSFDLLTLVFYESTIYIANSTFIRTKNGFLLVLNKEQTNNSLASNTLIIKTDSNGQEIWRKEFGDLEYDETISEIVQVNDNEFVLAGSKGDYPEWNDPFWPLGDWSSSYFFAIDSNGNQLWDWFSDSTKIQGFVSKHHLLPDSSWLCIGLTWEFSTTGNQYKMRPMIFRIDKNFEIIWQKYIGYIGQFQFLGDLEMTKDSNFVASGFADLIEYPAYARGIHYKFSADGDSIWMRTDSIYGNDKTRFQSTEILSSGSIISVGYVYSSVGDAGIIIKLSPDGCIDTLNCLQLTSHYLTQAKQISSYPNPTSKLINVSIPEGTNEKKYIHIYNSQGKLIKTLNSTENQLRIDVSNLVSGFYIIKIQSKKQTLISNFVKTD